MKVYRTYSVEFSDKKLRGEMNYMPYVTYVQAQNTKEARKHFLKDIKFRFPKAKDIRIERCYK